MDISILLKHVDHTLLKPFADEKSFEKLVNYFWNHL